MSRGVIFYKGRSTPLQEGLTVIGRDPVCTLRVQDDEVSRHHAAIVSVGGGFFAIDLRSANGLYVNGKRVKSQEIRGNDEIQVGLSTIQVRVVEAGVQQVGPGWSDPYERLLSLVARIHGNLALEGFAERVAATALTAVDADRARVELTWTGGGQTVHLERAEDRLAELEGEGPATTRGVCEAVAASREALLVMDVPSGEGLPEGVQASSEDDVGSLACVPLVFDGEGLGTLYLDVRVTGGRLDEGILDVLAILADNCAVALSNARLIREIHGA